MKEDKHMATVEFFGLYRLDFGVAAIETEASSIEELLEQLEKRFKVHTAKDLRNSIIIVNDVSFLKLKKYKTRLEKGDRVFIMSPASGG